MTRIGVLLASVLAIASSAAAHNRIAESAPAIAFRFEGAAQDRVQPLPTFSASAFADVAHLDLPSRSTVDQLEQRTKDVLDYDASERALTLTRSWKLASGVRVFVDRNNVSEESKLGGKVRWGRVIQAAPFQEAATGLIYFRARWYDPGTGSFLTPDPNGYDDSSNLYQFGAGDPINNRDPRGECLGVDKAGRPCSYYARMLPDVIAESLGLKDLPSTGSKEIDKKIRKMAEAPARASALPAAAVLSTGDSTGELLYRMERSTFHGEQALDPSSLDDALLVTNVMGDAATFIAPLGLLEGELPSLGRAGKTKAVSTPRSRTNYASYGSETLEAVPATRVKPMAPGRPSWRTSEQNAASEIKSFGFVEQRSFINGKEVPYGTPGSVRPDLTSDAMHLSVDIKNYDLTTPGGRYNLVQNVVGQATSRSQHLPAGYRQGLILDVRGQDVNTRLLNAMVDRIVKKSGGAIKRENVYFLGID